MMDRLVFMITFIQHCLPITNKTSKPFFLYSIVTIHICLTISTTRDLICSFLDYLCSLIIKCYHWGDN